MTTQNLLTLLVAKLVGIRVFVQTKIKDANQHPEDLKFIMRLDGFLRVTQEELLEAFGMKTRDKLPVNVQSAVVVVSRIFRGKDSYRVIAEKVEVLIKRLHPIHVELLKRVTLESSRKAEREALESSRKAEREALEKRFATLSGGKALPDGTESSLLSSMVTELRDDLVAKTQRLMNEVSEPALRHPDIGRLGDKSLVAIKARLDERFKELHAVKPRSFAEQFAQRAVQ